MKRVSCRRFVIILVLLGAPCVSGQTWEMQNSATTASLRGISAVDARTAWASGTAGTCLRTTDAGNTWRAAVVPGAAALDFRGVDGISSREAVLMSSGPGKASAVYNTTDNGGSWKLLFANPDAAGFFDAIAFPSHGRGFLLGDPVAGAFALFRTHGARPSGSSWERVPLPDALPGEGAFAASNRSLVVQGQHIWFATGGPKAARVFRSWDSGAHWSVAKTPLLADGPGAGIFALAFSDYEHGIAVGGDYTKPGRGDHSVAVTADGGETWVEPAGSGVRGYRSAVAWLPQHKLWIATGPTGSELSRDGGQTWTAFDDGAFNAVSVAPGDACWAVGPKGRIARLVFDGQKKR